MTEEQPEIVGWRILNEYGEIVASGPVTVAEMAADTAELLEEREIWQE